MLSEKAAPKRRLFFLAPIIAEQLGKKTLMMKLNEKYPTFIVKRFIALKNSADGCLLIRDGSNTPLSGIGDYKKDLNSEKPYLKVTPKRQFKEKQWIMKGN